MRHIPLSFALALQVVVVTAAFAAVIAVLSMQQQTEFKDSLYQRLQTQQRYVLERIVGPLLDRRSTFDMHVASYLNGRRGSSDGGGGGAFASPSDDASSMALDKAQAFYDHFYILPHLDPMVRLVLIANQSRVPRGSYQTTTTATTPTASSLSSAGGVGDGAGSIVLPRSGRRVVPRTWRTARNTTWNIWAADYNKVASCYREEAALCVSLTGYPHIRSPCASPALATTQPYNTAAALQAPIEHTAGPMWSTLNVVDDQISRVNHEVLTYNHPISLVNGHQFSFALSFAVSHIRPLIRNNTAHSSSRAAVFQRFSRLEAGGAVEHPMVGGRVDFDDWDAEIINVTGAWQDGVWEGGQTPDPILNSAFTLVKDMFPHETSSAVVEMKHGDTRYVVSVARFVEEGSRMNWLFVEYTDRSVFFAASDAARVTGILIGVAGGLVVLVVCLLIWFAVRVPLRHLSVNMALAADLRNSEVMHADPILAEISVVNASFIEMNAKLLAAIPFLPQSLLARRRGGAGDTSDDENLDDEEEDDEGAADDAEDETLSRLNLSEGASTGVGGALNNKPQRGGYTPNPRGIHTATSDECVSRTASIGVGYHRHIVATDSISASTVAQSQQHISSSTYKYGGFPAQQHHGQSPPTNTGAGGNSASNNLSNHHRQQQHHHKAIELRRVGVLVINVINFHGALLDGGVHRAGGCSAARPHAIANLSLASASYVHTAHGLLARIVEQCAAEEKGIVDLFHGDRFVVSFNTVRMCGNTYRNGAEAAVKVWDRFCASPQLVEAFPLGLSMGLAVGRAAVGNHGTDTMQRLATIGPVYTEAVRLQEVMSRRVLLLSVPPPPPRGGGGGGLNGAVSPSTAGMTITPMHSAPNNNASFSSPPSTVIPNPLIAGRCLVMGRTVQEIESSSSTSRRGGGGPIHCQIVGAVSADNFLPSVAGACSDGEWLKAFAKGRNAAVMMRGGGGGGAVPSNAQAYVADIINQPPAKIAMEGLCPPPVSGNAMGDHCCALPVGPLLRDCVLVAVVCSPTSLRQHGRHHHHDDEDDGGVDCNGNGDEWLYEVRAKADRMPFAKANAVLHGLFVHGRAWGGGEGGGVSRDDLVLAAGGADAIGGDGGDPLHYVRYVAPLTVSSPPAATMRTPVRRQQAMGHGPCASGGGGGGRHVHAPSSHVAAFGGGGRMRRASAAGSITSAAVSPVPSGSVTPMTPSLAPVAVAPPVVGQSSSPATVYLTEVLATVATTCSQQQLPLPQLWARHVLSVVDKLEEHPHRHQHQQQQQQQHYDTRQRCDAFSTSTAARRQYGLLVAGRLVLVGAVHRSGFDVGRASPLPVAARPCPTSPTSPAQQWGSGDPHYPHSPLGGGVFPGMGAGGAFPISEGEAEACRVQQHPHLIGTPTTSTSVVRGGGAF